MKNIKFIALISPLILCGCSCSSTTTYAIVLRSGEGTFLDGKTYLILDNVREGTPLNEIEGYTTPVKNENYMFDVWLNDEGKAVENTIQINSNIQLTASYVEGPKYYIDIINEEKNAHLNYANDEQNSYDFPRIMNAISNASIDVLKNVSTISSYQAKYVYNLTHFCLEKMAHIDVVKLRRLADIKSQYEQILKIYLEDLACLTTDHNLDKLDALEKMGENHLNTHLAHNTEFINNVYHQHVNNIIDADTPLNLCIAAKLGNGFVRGAEYLYTEIEYKEVLDTIQNKLDEAKKAIAQEDKLMTFIDFLGDCVTTYCKIIHYGRKDTDFKNFETMYNKALALINASSNESFAQNKLRMILAFMKANSYSRVSPDIDIENELLQEIETKLKKETADGITDIVVHGAEALQLADERSSEDDFLWFINDTIRYAIESYLETPSFLDCSLYAMDIARHLKDYAYFDAYTKEYQTPAFDGTQYNNYMKISLSLRSAYDLYFQNFSMVPQENLKSFKIIIQAVIRAGLILPRDVNSTPFIVAFNNAGFEYIRNSSTIVANGMAYALAGFASCYAKLDNMNGSGAADYFASVQMKETVYKSLFQKWNDIISQCNYEDISAATGQAIGESWGSAFPWIYSVYKSKGDVQGAYDHAMTHVDNWLNRIKEGIPKLTETNVKIMKDAYVSTLASSRFYHFALKCPGTDIIDESKMIEVQNNILNLTGQLYAEIYNSQTPEQVAKRAQIYVSNFIGEINRRNNSLNYNDDLDTLSKNVLNQMKGV